MCCLPAGANGTTIAAVSPQSTAQEICSGTIHRRRSKSAYGIRSTGLSRIGTRSTPPPVLPPACLPLFVRWSLTRTSRRWRRPNGLGLTNAVSIRSQRDTDHERMAAESTPATLLCAPSADRTQPAPAALLSHWWIAFAASSLFVVSGHLAYKGGPERLSSFTCRYGISPLRVLHSVLQFKVLAGLSIYLIGTVCWMRAVSKRRSASCIRYRVLILCSLRRPAWCSCRKPLSGRRIAGILLVVLGMVLMNTRSEKVAHESESNDLDQRSVA